MLQRPQLLAMTLIFALFGGVVAHAERLRISVSDEPRREYGAYERIEPTERGGVGRLDLLRRARIRRSIEVPHRWQRALGHTLLTLATELGEARDQLIATPATRDTPGQLVPFSGRVHLTVREDVLTGIAIVPDRGPPHRTLIPVTLGRGGWPVLPRFFRRAAFAAGNEDFYLLGEEGFAQLMVLEYDETRREVTATFSEDFWGSFLNHPSDTEVRERLTVFRVGAPNLYYWDERVPFPFPIRQNPGVERWYPPFVGTPRTLEYPDAAYSARALGLFSFEALLEEIQRDCAKAMSRVPNQPSPPR